MIAGLRLEVSEVSRTVATAPSWFSARHLPKADEHAKASSRTAPEVIADDTPTAVKATAGLGRVVRFRLTADQTAIPTRP